MIGVALGLEMRTLLRSPLRLLVLALVLGAGIFVIVQGQRDVRRWQETIEAARLEQDETLTEARDLFAAGRVGPEDRPWVNLTTPRWQDSYAATRLVREPAPLAGIAFASAEVGTLAVGINRYANPLLSQGTKIENPELAATGGLDLVTVLALLLPLMILAMGLEIGSHERASGILPLVRVQSGADRSWISARCIAIGILASAVGLLLAGIVCVASATDLVSAALLCLMILAYIAVWTALLAAVALLARHPSQGAVALGAAWMVLCVLVPAIGVERSAALAADDFAVDLTVEARDAGQAIADLDDEAVFSTLFGRFASLEEQAPDDRSAGSRAARGGLRIVELEKRMDRREEQGQAQARLVKRMAIASPAVAFTHALEGLAGRGPEAAQAYRRAVVAAAADRMERYIGATWTGEPLDAGDFEALHAATPAQVPSSVSPVWREFLLLVAWAVVVVGGAVVVSRRSSRSAATGRLESGIPMSPELPLTRPDGSI